MLFVPLMVLMITLQYKLLCILVVVPMFLLSCSTLYGMFIQCFDV